MLHVPAKSRPPAAHPIPPEYRGHLGFLVAKARHFLVNELDAALVKQDFSMREFGMLSLLRQKPELRQTDIGEALGIDRTTTMKLVDGMEKRGFVERVRHARDGRAYNIEITPAGSRFFERVLPLVIEGEQRFMAPLSPGERALLQEMLLRLVDSSLERRNANDQQ